MIVKHGSETGEWSVSLAKLGVMGKEASLFYASLEETTKKDKQKERDGE